MRKIKCVCIIIGILLLAGCATPLQAESNNWIPSEVPHSVSSGLNEEKPSQGEVAMPSLSVTPAVQEETGEDKPRLSVTPTVQEDPENDVPPQGEQNTPMPSAVPPALSEEKNEEVPSKEDMEPGKNESVSVERVLVVGNSITLGFGTHGMASSAVETDYYYLLNQYLLEKNPDVEMKRIPGYAWESGKTSEKRAQFLNENLLPELETGYDLLLIQLGDNVNMPEKLVTFAKDTEEMLKLIRDTAPNIRILWVFGRYNLSNAEVIREACAKYEAEYVDISIVSTDKKYQAAVNDEYEMEDGTIGFITEQGVASHPNDYAMQVICELIIEQLGYEKEE